MRIDASTILFFDASCLIAAAGSPQGGSGFLLSVCAKGYLQAAVSDPVLVEAERNILENLRPGAIDTYDQLMRHLPGTVVPAPSKREQRRYQAKINDKDVHVVAAAIISQAPFLITLDVNLARQVNQAGLPIQAFTPGEFIRTYLPQHADYPKIR